MRRKSSHGSSTFVILHSSFTFSGVSERSRTVTFWFTARRAETATLQTPSFSRIQYSAEGTGFEPASQLSENRVSTAARPTISGYLPYRCERVAVEKLMRLNMSTLACSFTPSEWTAGESNPDCLLARQESSRWTSSPIDRKHLVAEMGVEPTKSRVSRTRRFAGGLRTRPMIAGPGVAPDGLSL